MLRRFLVLFKILCLLHLTIAWTNGQINSTVLQRVRNDATDADISFDRRPAYDANISAPLKNGKSSSDKMNENKEATETQHAVCQVTTEQLVASAEATVTRVLSDLCTSKEIEARFNEIEIAILGRLNDLKFTILNLETRVDEYNEALRRGSYQQMETLFKHCDNPKTNIVESLSAKSTPNSSKNSHDDENDNETEPNEASPRENEIQKFNSSISIEPNGHGPPKKVFTYYWKIPQIRQKLQGMQTHQSIRSSSFYIYLGGYRLYLRSYPRQRENNIFVHVGVTKGEFDEALKWPFSLKIRVNILDQTPRTPVFEDIASRTWDPTVLCSEFNWQKPTKGDNYECVGLGFPHDLLFQRKYIFNDAIIIKLSVYLDS